MCQFLVKIELFMMQDLSHFNYLYHNNRKGLKFSTVS